MSALTTFTIFYSPADYPGRYVVRRFLVGPTAIVADPHPLAVADSLIEARLVVPPALACLPADPDDDPVIVETWL